MRPAGLAWLLLLVFAAGFEGWAVATNHATLSEWIWSTDTHHAWFRYLILGLDGLLMLHFFARVWRP